jgi:hypothetical protein
VRLGSYGDPVHIPIGIIRWIVFFADKVTGYTHQWRQSQYQAYREYLMASADSTRDYADAKAAGWRVFRVRAASEHLQAAEIACPASDEAGKRTQCERCELCNGAKGFDCRKDIAIIVHGTGSKNFVSLQATARA